MSNNKPVVEQERKLSVFDACSIVEGFDGEEHTDEEVLAAWQVLVDTGVCWQLQGRFGRTARDLIEAGLVSLPGGQK